MVDFYKKVLEKHKNIILMGDSSGGGFATSLCLYLSENGTVLPQNLILFSPWVDISLENNKIAEYQKIDPFISASNEKIWGKLWAGDIDIKDYRVSPIYSKNLNELKNVILFVGTREVLYPDVVLFHEKLLEANVNSKLIVGENQNHVYPIYPTPEGNKVLNEIIKIIDENFR